MRDQGTAERVNWWQQKRFREKLLLIAFTAVCLLIVLHFSQVWSGIRMVTAAVKPLIYGLIVAFILNLPTNFFERLFFRRWTTPKGLKVRRALSFLLSLFIVLSTVTIILLLIIPQAVESIQVFIRVFPDFYGNAIAWLDEATRRYPAIHEQIVEITPDISTVLNQLSSNLSAWATNALSVVSGIAGGAVNAVLAFVFAIYLVLSKHRLKIQLDRLLGWMLDTKRKSQFYGILRISTRTFSDFIAGQVLEAVILGTLCTVGMLVFGFPYATMVGAFVGLTALIPLVGAFIGGGFGAIIIATQDPVKALFFVIFLVVLQQLEGDLIYPKVVGDKIGLPGMWVLAGVTVGGALYGIPGTLIGVPVMATLYKLLRNKTLQEEGKISDWLEGDRSPGLEEPETQDHEKLQDDSDQDA